MLKPQELPQNNWRSSGGALMTGLATSYNCKRPLIGIWKSLSVRMSRSDFSLIRVNLSATTHCAVGVNSLPPIHCHRFIAADSLPPIAAAESLPPIHCPLFQGHFIAQFFLPKSIFRRPQISKIFTPKIVKKISDA